MIKIPKLWIKHLENASNHCQTFLSSCCLIDYEKENSEKIRILSHNTGVRKNGELLLSSKNIINEYNPINFFKKPTSQILQTKFSPPNHNPTPINTDELLKRLKLLHLFPELLKQTPSTPPTTPIIRSMAPSPEMDRKKDLKSQLEVLQLFNFKEERGEIKALEELNRIDKAIIKKYREIEISGGQASQILKINVESKNFDR
jgi:hypothetical protein